MAWGDLAWGELAWGELSRSGLVWGETGKGRNEKKRSETTVMLLV